MSNEPFPPPSEPSLFSRIIAGDLPGRFVWRDAAGPDAVVAFLTIAPIRPGHVLVVPVAQIDQWTDLPPSVWARVTEVSQRIGAVLGDLFECERVALLIAGLEVPHCHVHLVPIRTEADLSFALADTGASSQDLDAAAAQISEALAS